MSADGSTTRPPITAETLSSGLLGPVTVNTVELKEPMLSAAPSPATVATILSFSKNMQPDGNKEIRIGPGPDDKIGLNVTALAMDTMPKQALTQRPGSMSIQTTSDSGKGPSGPARG